MKAAGAIAVLVRRGHIEAIPGKYEITETGRSILATQQEEEPKKGKRKSRKEPQEPSNQGDQQSP